MAEIELYRAIDQLKEAEHLAGLRAQIDPRISLESSPADSIGGLVQVGMDLLESIRIVRWRGTGRACEHAIGIQAICSVCAEAASKAARHG